jgi:hypothetical protein
MGWNGGMANADPKTEVRRERFRALCKARGWFDTDRQRWAVTDIAAATMKQRQKVSDLLNGAGSFGSKIAREIEIALELPEYYLDSVDLSAGTEQEPAVRAADPPKPASDADDVERFVSDVVDVIGQYLQNVDENGRAAAALALSMYAKNPAGERERVIGMLAAAMRGAPLQPIDPTPTKSTRKSRASLKVALKPKLELRLGGGQQRMFSVPTPPLQKIMRDEDAPEREQEWYKALKKLTKTADGGKR